MYLSKVTLDPGHPQVRRDLADPYEMHRTLTRLYARDDRRKPERFLWRLEPQLRHDHPPTVLVQAATTADWSTLAGLSGYARRIEGDKIIDLVQLVHGGAAYRFRIRANPTVTRSRKRIGLSREGEQIAWLSRQADKHGFELLACLRLDNQRTTARRGGSDGRIVLQSVLFEGLLRVKDTAGTVVAVQTGLGHGKALGLGMLSLARYRGPSV